jgi:hypothetical protein
MLACADRAATDLRLPMRVTTNDCLHPDPREQQARIAVAALLLAQRMNPANAVRHAAAQRDIAAPADHAIDHLAGLLAARPRYATRRGHYQPYGLRHASR